MLVYSELASLTSVSADWLAGYPLCTDTQLNKVSDYYIVNILHLRPVFFNHGLSGPRRCELQILRGAQTSGGEFGVDGI